MKFFLPPPLLVGGYYWLLYSSTTTTPVHAVGTVKILSSRADEAVEDDDLPPPAAGAGAEAEKMDRPVVFGSPYRNRRRASNTPNTVVNHNAADQDDDNTKTTTRTSSMMKMRRKMKIPSLQGQTRSHGGLIRNKKEKQQQQPSPKKQKQGTSSSSSSSSATDNDDEEDLHYYNDLPLTTHATTLFHNLPDASSFVERLRQQEEQETQELQRRTRQQLEEALQQQKQKQQLYSKWTQPLIWTGAVIVGGVSLYQNSNIQQLQDTLHTSMAALLLAWIPSLIVQGVMMVVLGGTTTGAAAGSTVMTIQGLEYLIPLLGLWIQPTTRLYLQQILIPSIWKTWKKIFWSEFWRHTWLIILAPIPKQLLLPKYYDGGGGGGGGGLPQQLQQQIPEWTQDILQFTNTMVDRFTRSLLTKTIQQSVQTSLIQGLDTIMIGMNPSLMVADWYHPPENEVVVIGSNEKVKEFIPQLVLEPDDDDDTVMVDVYVSSMKDKDENVIDT